MTSKQVTSRDDLLQFIRSGGTYADALQLFIRSEDAKLKETRAKSTVAGRKAALKEAVKQFDAEVLVPLQETMEAYVDKMMRLSIDEPRELSPAEAHQLMNEYLDYQQVSEFMATRRETIKELVFMSIDEALRAKGKDPDTTNGEIPVPELGKVFRKEGAGLKDPYLDEKKLRRLLGERSALVFDMKVIPAETVTVLNEDKLMLLAQQEPEVMEMIREALVPGAPKSPRFVVRDLAQEEA